MAVKLFDDGRHKCLAFVDLVQGEGVQSNQFLITHGQHAALIDPGGDLTFTALSIEISKVTPLKSMDYLIASHQDPDIIASLTSWISRTDAKFVCPQVWVRFLPHLIPNYMGSRVMDRAIGVPDSGMDLPLGDTVIKAIPAHFLHSVGNLHFYDSVSRILFSGDMGTSVGVEGVDMPVEDFEAHIPRMEGFHRRYMAGNKVCRLWAEMVRGMDVDMIVPQHGRPFKGREMISRFLDWIANLECGIDLLTQDNYRIP